MQVIFSPEFELILLLSHEKDREIKGSEEVPVKILNSYKVTQEESDTFRKSLGLDLRKVLLLKNVL